ncbi:class I SAM-dependent methyltransferase [Sandarakinorhabdus limnophila]|uniref:class I SAM-dependent methyltransferase n=1 Tax=Sandarakinorhabdus limnophila TaxID=210512 RepID=UPI0026EAEB9E|nr:class I SAM-dependent methyltransferase [Sandarakinorhabdus limnophila]
MKVRDLQHALLPTLTEEEKSRQRMVVALRRTINGRLRPRNVALYKVEGAPAFAARHGRAPQSPEDVANALFLSTGYRMWSAMNRASQEMIWVAAGAPLVRDAARAEAASRTVPALGSLHLDPAFDPPGEIADIDIHLQPGGYTMDRGEGDLLAGALYEAGGNIYAFGQGVGKGDSKAGAVIRHLEARHPGIQPERILDLGCSAGAATCAWAAHFPDADVHGVDIGAGMLRYAHARAAALGVAVHFHQADAADLSAFADDSFDLVVSHNLLHEIGREQRRAMLAEARRVVRPGGMVFHQDVPTRFVTELVARVERAWDTSHNGEAFWNIYAGDDLVADMVAAGFAPADIEELRLSQVDGAMGWYLLAGGKPA